MTASTTRLGPAAVYLLQLARGTTNRPLRPLLAGTSYQERFDLEYPVEVLEPLMFISAPDQRAVRPAPSPLDGHHRNSFAARSGTRPATSAACSSRSPPVTPRRF